MTSVKICLVMFINNFQNRKQNDLTENPINYLCQSPFKVCVNAGVLKWRLIVKYKFFQKI